MMMMVSNELRCSGNRLGGGPDVGLIGGTLPSPKGLDKWL